MARNKVSDVAKMKHTPGPWKAHYRPNHRMRVTTNLGVPALGDDTICEIALWNVAYDEQMANARLIAAAPDLAWFTAQILDGIATGLIHIDTPAAETLENILRKGRSALTRANGGTGE